MLMKKYSLLFVLLLTLFTACEKGDADSDSAAPVEGSGHLVALQFKLPANPLYPEEYGEVDPPASMGAYLGHLSIAVFQDGKRLYIQHQHWSNAYFGTYQVRLPEGEYQLVAVLYDSTGNATISSPEEIKFPDNKVSDTFYHYSTLHIGGPVSQSVTLQRATAKVLFRCGDPIPEGVSQMKFYYTGGSSTFNAVTGLGSVNSRQTEYRQVPEEAIGQYMQFSLYTFPHEQDDVLKLTVTALGKNEEELQKAVYEGVVVSQRALTYEDHYFFSNDQYGETSEIEFTLGATTDVSQIDCAY